VKTLALLAIGALALGACKGKSEDKSAAGSGSGSAAAKAGGFGSGASSSAAGSGSGSGSAKAAGSAASNEIPKECDDWKAMVDKLVACEKMPEPQRKIMKDAYDQAATLWPTMPPATKSQLATSCKAGAEAIMSSAKATCGW
jgi:hypothetical protein